MVIKSFQLKFYYFPIDLYLFVFFIYYYISTCEDTVSFFILCGSIKN